MCKFCGCARGRAQHSLLFLEVIGDLLEKQETLGLLVYILPFLFLFSNRFHPSQSQDVLRAFMLYPALQASSLTFLPTCASSFSLPLTFCRHPPPHPQSLLRGGGRSREPRTQVPHLGDVCNFGHVLLGSLASPHLPFSSYPSPTFITVVRQEAEWSLPTGTCWGSFLLLTHGGNAAGMGNPSSLLGQTGAGGVLRNHFISLGTQRPQVGCLD